MHEVPEDLILANGQEYYLQNINRAVSVNSTSGNCAVSVLLVYSLVVHSCIGHVMVACVAHHV